MKVKDWLSVVNLNGSDCFCNIEICDNEWHLIETFNTIKYALEAYGENKIKEVNFETFVYDDDINIQLQLDIEHVR